MANDEPSVIFPVNQLFFECCGCKTRWMARVDPPIRSVVEFDAYTKDPRRMESCPRDCGAATVNIAFKISAARSIMEPAPAEEPFTIFDKFHAQKKDEP